MPISDIHSEIKRRVDHVLTEEFEVAPEAIRPDAAIIDDLGLDSLDIVDLVVCIEREFDGRMEEDHVRTMRTVGDIYAYIESQWGDRLA